MTQDHESPHDSSGDEDEDEIIIHARHSKTPAELRAQLQPGSPSEEAGHAEEPVAEEAATAAEQVQQATVDAGSPSEDAVAEAPAVADPTRYG